MRIRAYRKPGEMNKLEAEYASYLESLRLAGDILEYKYEPESLKLGKDCRYTPDFRVIKKTIVQLEMEDGSDHYESAGVVEFHEVKGTTRKRKVQATDAGVVLINTFKPYIEDDALVKIKAAAEQHPYKFILVFKGDGGKWDRKEIN